MGDFTFYVSRILGTLAPRWAKRPCRGAWRQRKMRMNRQPNDMPAFQSHSSPAGTVEGLALEIKPSGGSGCDAPRKTFVAAGVDSIHFDAKIANVWPNTFPLIRLKRF